MANQDLISFSSKIKYLLNNPNERKKMSEKGKELARFYNWDKLSDEIEKYYFEVLSK